MASLEALIFDVDGTLADTERDGHRVAFNAAFAEAGLPWDWTPEVYGQLLAVTGGKERITHYLAHFDPPAAERVATPEVIAGLHRAKTRHYTALLAHGGIPLRPGIERLLREAREAGLRLAIATTTTPANVYALLDSTLGVSARDWFEVIGAGDIVPAKKPAPDIYDWVLERLALAPARCMALEDSDNGLKAANEAGIRSVLITVNAYTRGQDFAAAPWVLEDLGEPGRPPVVLKGTVETGDGVTVADLRRMHEGVATDSRFRGSSGALIDSR